MAGKWLEIAQKMAQAAFAGQRLVKGHLCARAQLRGYRIGLN